VIENDMNESLDQLIRRILERFLSGEAKLPVLPDSVLRISAIVKDDSKGAIDIANVIADDASFSVTVLKLANSACFNFSHHEIRSLPIAVQRLGAKRTLQLLMAISSKMHMHVSDQRLQRIIRKSSDYSIKVAAMAQQLADQLMTADPGEAFTAGLLHDIGTSALICSARKDLEDLSPNVQIKVIQMLRREIGALLLSRWELPHVFSIIAKYHGIQSDQRPLDVLIDYVDGADCLLQHAGHKVLFEPLEDTTPLNHPSFQRLGATQADLDTATEAFDSRLEELKQVFNT